jgi:hypothetical protein
MTRQEKLSVFIAGLTGLVPVLKRVGYSLDPTFEYARQVYFAETRKLRGK